MEKREVYAKLKVDLKKAISCRFYYQAIFIESAILEDRCRSVLKHTRIDPENKNFHRLLLLLQSRPEFTPPRIRKYLPLSLIEDILNWKKERNTLVHNLANLPYDDDRLEKVALSGRELVYRLENGVKSVNRYFDKQGVEANEKANE